MKGPRKTFSAHLLTLFGTLGIAAAGLLVFLAIGGGLPGSSGHKVRALVPTSASLTPGSRVTMSGVEVGSVTSVERQGLGALVGFEITDERVIPLPADSRARVRLRTAAGENYLEIEPGRSSEELQADAVLPAEQAAEYVDADRILSVLKGRSRERARRLIQGLGGALEGRGERLNALLGGAAGSLKVGSRVVEVLAEQREQVGRLVEQLGEVADAVGARGADIKDLAKRGLVAFRAIARQDDALRKLLDELPPTLSVVRTATSTLGSVSTNASPVVANAAHAVRELDPAVRLLRPATEEGKKVLARLGAAAPGLEQTLARLRAVARPGAEALPKVGKTLCHVNPMLEYLKPYTPDVVQTVVGLASTSNSYDAFGHLQRLTPIVTDNALVGLPREMSKAAHTLIHAGILSKVNGLNWNPYPEPGSIGKSSAAGKSIMGPEDLAASGWKYPRIHAEC